jgi:6-phosphogluconolactonase
LAHIRNISLPKFSQGQHFITLQNVLDKISAVAEQEFNRKRKVMTLDKNKLPKFASMTTRNYQHIKVGNRDELVAKGVEFMKQKITGAIKTDNICIVGLSGGTTPWPIYEKLSGDPEIDWTKVFVFLVDERYVDKNHQDSNQRSLANTLLKNKAIPQSNVVLPNTDLRLEECIKDYAERLNKLLMKSKTKTADLVTLGLGEDGHIASIFPALDKSLHDKANDPSILVIHTTTDRFPGKVRISTTFSIIANAKSQVFFLQGSNKLRVWQEMVDAKTDYVRWPAHRVIETGHTTVISSEH